VTRVNIIGKLEGDLSILGTIKPGDEVTIEQVSSD
jgi:hypothetical protein